MAPMSRGTTKMASRVTKLPRKVKKTPSTQKHRFEPFSQRISNLRVKPVRLNAQDRAHADLEDEQSHFRIALEEWQDRDMSTPFVELAEKVEPLCQNLPQVIHHEGRIVDALLQALPTGNIYSLEPMLVLVVQLAYDIRQRFEAYFERMIRAVSSIAATHADVEVIEWTFNCLAALFKHFERLLVQDVRPLYDVMAPLLGKQRQKSFVCRFTAQAFSFLVRKAATATAEHAKVLDDFTLHVFQDLQSTTFQQVPQHQQSIMTMYSEAIKGVQGSVRNGGPAILRSLLDLTSTDMSAVEGRWGLLRQTVGGILTGIIHHTDAEGFTPALTAILDFAQSCLATMTNNLRSLCADVLFIVISVRKGTRIQSATENSHDQWFHIAGMLETLVLSVNEAESAPPPHLIQSLLNTVVVYLQYCPTRNASRSNTLVEHICKEYWQADFVRFCIFTSDLGLERFDSTLRKHLETFVVRHWVNEPELICALLARLPHCAQIRSRLLNCLSTQQGIVDEFHTVAKAFEAKEHVDDSRLYLVSQYLEMCKNKDLPIKIQAKVSDFTRQLLRNALDPVVAGTNPPVAALALSKCLASIDLTESGILQQSNGALDLLNVSAAHGVSVGYLAAIRKHLSTISKSMQATHADLSELLDALVKNLCSPSGDLRLVSLEILVDLCHLQQEQPPSALDTALVIERSTFDVNSMRAIAMNVRKLGQADCRIDTIPWLGRAVVSFLFGLLHVRLTPILNDVCDSLSSLSSDPHLQSEIMSRCIDWLQRGPGTNDASADEDASDSLPWMERTTEFQCTNLMQVQELSKKSFNMVAQAPDKLKHAFDIEVGTSPRTVPANRSQALRVLCKLTSTAEKMSRVLVPVFLDWFQKHEDKDLPEMQLDSDDETLLDPPMSPPAMRCRPSRDDKKGMLTLFSSFLNPRVLYKSNEIYVHLLHELCSGDTDIQRLALKAILSWKSPATKPYEENMMNLLDDARFRNELTVFLAVENESSVIRAEHVEGLLPVLLRLLYGRSVARTKDRGGQRVKRQAVLLSIARFGHGALGQFIQIALQPLDSISTLLPTDPPRLDDQMIDSQNVSPRMQVGYLRMIHAILDALPNLVPPFATQLMEVILLCLVRSTRTLDNSRSTVSGTKVTIEHESMVKSVRQEGFRCLELLFRHCPGNDWNRYTPALLDAVVRPRVENLPIETAQGTSTVLRLLSTWASSQELVYILLDNRTSILLRVADCLTVPSARDEVKLFVLKDIIGKLLELAGTLENEASQGTTNLAARLHEDLAQAYLDRISELLASSPSREIIEGGVKTLTKLAPFLKDSSQVDGLVGTAVKLLSPGIKGIPPHLRSRLLFVLEQYLPKSNIRANDQAFKNSVDVLSVLFSYFLDAPSRALLARVFRDFVTDRPGYAISGRLCQQLNAFSSSRLEEPDYDTRLQAINAITGEETLAMDAGQWRPIVHNMLFLLHDDAQFSSMRSGASEGLRYFVRFATTRTNQARNESESGLAACIDHEVLPALCRGMREPLESVRLENLRILAELVDAGYTLVQDLVSLLGSDVDMSFFDGILHIQQSRRLSALRKLAASASTITSSNISRILLPLVETIISTGDDGSQAVTDEAIRTLDAVVECLEWNKYRHLLQRMTGEKQRFESKQPIRVLGAAVNALYRAQSKKIDSKELDTALAKSLPAGDVLAKSLTKGCLSQLLEYTHFKNESTVDLRMIVAATAVKMIMTYSPEEINAQLPPVLMDLCNVLRSKAQEARDAARKTLADISAVIGPSYFGFLVKQLKSSLQRGTQLHVMSYTVHSLLVVVAPLFRPGDLDYCLSDIMNVIIDDVYGTVGQEKESDGFTSKMNEVRKKSLGFDSLELLASFTSPQCVGALLRPIRSHLERLKPRLEKSDKLLRQLQEGLRRNERFNDRQALTLCYEVLRDSLQTDSSVPFASAPARYKLATFALDLLRRTIDKHEALKTRENLQGFVPLLAQAMSTGETSSIEASLRVFTSIVKLPIPELDQNAGEYMKLAKSTLNAESSTQSSLAQASLRLVSALLRERPNAVVKQSDFEATIAYMLKRITPDLHEPAHSHERGRQVGAFNLLKAALGRGVLITEIYEVMDTVREVMVTSPEPEIRSSARSVYCRFILDYFPEEGKGFVKQIEFLKKNLQYEQPHGRESVMDVVDYLLHKKKGNDKSTQSLISQFWEDLLDLLITDTIARSRDVARVLLVKLFERSDSDSRKTIKSKLLKLVDAGLADLIQRAGYRGWDAYFEADASATLEADTVLDQAQTTISVIQPTMKRRKALLVEDILQNYLRLCGSYPDTAFGLKTADAWTTISTTGASSSYPRVRLVSLRLVNAYLENFAKSAAQSLPQQVLPLYGSAGLQLDRNALSGIITSSTAVFKEDFETTVAAHASQILATVARLPLGDSAASIVSHILSQLSSMIRQEGAPTKSKLVALHLSLSLAERQPNETIEPAMQDMLFMLSNLTDSAIAPAFGEEEMQEQLSEAAQQMLDVLKSRLGPNEFIKQFQQVQNAVRERREERKAKRSIQVVSQPEQAGKEKVRKGAAKRQKRKERNDAFAGRRRGY